MIIPPPSDFLIGYHFSPRVVPPAGTGSSGILCCAEASGRHEDEDLIPLHPKADAGSVFARALRRAGISRDSLTLTNVCWQRPPNNELENQIYEPEARAYWLPYNQALIVERKPKVIILLGNSALKAFTEFGYDDKTTITHMMGYSLPQPDGTILLPTIHPSFILHGQQAFNQVLIWTLQRALQLTRSPLVALPTNYVTHPKLEDMLAFERGFDPARHTLSFDIETPESSNLDEEQVQDQEEDVSYNIIRASLCYDGDSGYAISFPWNEPFIPVAKRMLASESKKEVWNCPTPDQRILTADLRWVKAGELSVGDRLVGFDEEVEDGNRLRRYREASVTYACRGQAVVYDVSLSDGSHVKVTGEHPWLQSDGDHYADGIRGPRKYKWVQTKELRVSSVIRRLFETWSTDGSRDGGYLAGFYDGEGYVARYSGIRVGASQKDGKCLDHVTKLLEDRNYQVLVYQTNREKEAYLKNFNIGGGTRECARFLGSIRPVRLLNKFTPTMLGVVWAFRAPVLTITGVTCLGEQEIVRLSTSTSTYVLEGFGAHNSYFDVPRLRHAGAPINGKVIDRMMSWRFLQPTLPASLEFATPLLGWTNAPWKYVSQKEPEFYSAVDAHALRRNGMAIEAALAARGVTELHDRHVVECYEVLERMAQNGLPYDAPAAQEFKVRLEKMKVEREAELQQRVPDALKPVKQKKGYKKIPKDCSGLVKRKFRLKVSDLTGVEKDRLSQLPLFDVTTTLPVDIANPNAMVEVERWAKLEPFLATSTQQMQALVKWAGFKPGTNRKTKKATMDDETKRKLIAKCINSTRKKDQEFAETLKLCREVSQLSKVIGTYVKGWRPGLDGRIHAIPGFWGKMFRISWRRPNLAATIQDKTEDYIAAGFRKCVSVPPDRMLVEADWKGIEAVIVGYLAGDPDYIRLAKIGIHDYFCAHILASKGKIKTSDIPSLTLSDGELKKVFKWIRHDFPKDRDDAKHIIHGTAYGMTPPLMSSLYELPIAEAEHLQGFYFEIYPKIKIWQESVKEKAHRDIWLQNLFGYRMPFFEVYRWNSQRYERLLATWRKLDGFAPNGMRWTLTTIEQGWITAIRAGMAKGLSTEDAISKLCYDLGDDAKSAISFLPRDTAAAMLKEALLRLRPLAFSHYDAGFAIGCAHDAILVECPKSRTDEVASLLRNEMERPVPQLNNLVVNVELKAGQSWDSDGMEVIEVPTIEQIPAILVS